MPGKLLSAVKVIAEQRGWSFSDSRTTGVSFHRDSESYKLPFTYHV
jgi:hypothetical protein